MLIKENIIKQIYNTFGKCNFESGGILGSSDGLCISEYAFDQGNKEVEYFPNVLFLNRTIEKWNDKNVFFTGIIHSHRSSELLSYADIEYAKKVLNVNKSIIDKLYMFLYIMETRKLIVYCVNEYGEVISEKLCVCKN